VPKPERIREHEAPADSEASREPGVSRDPAADDPANGPLLLDSLLTLLAQPQLAQPTAATVTAPPLPAALLDELASRVLRRCSVGRDGATTTVRLEFGEGRFEGAEVLVQSEHGRVRVTIEGASATDSQALASALRQRLQRKHGLELEVVVA
jgi:hypothetical protein